MTAASSFGAFTSSPHFSGYRQEAANISS